MANDDIKQTAKAPEPLKSEQRRFQKATESMIELISRLYKNQVLLELNKGTIDKFADAQVGNYAVVLERLVSKVRRKILKRIDNKRIRKLTREVMLKTDARSKQLFYKRVAAQLGINPLSLIRKDGTTFDSNALIIETTNWLTKLRDETISEYTANSLRAMTHGRTISEILEQYDGMVEKRKNHAAFTARNQIQNYNSMMTKARAQGLGAKRAIWLTSEDERVRTSHEVRDGKEFDLSKGLYSSVDGKWLFPGSDYQCRCNMQIILDDDEEDE